VSGRQWTAEVSHSRTRVPRLAWVIPTIVVALLPLVVAAPTVRFSDLSISAVATILVLLTATLAIIASPRFLRVAIRDAAPFLVFAFVGAASAILQPFNLAGVQNLAVVASFGLAILLGAMPYTDAVERWNFFDRWLTIGGLALATYAVSSYAILSRDILTQNRVLALALAVIVLWNWSGASRWGSWVGYLLFAVVIVTLSRTAAAATLGIALVIWSARSTGGVRARRITAAILVATAVVSLAVTTDNPIRERFTTGDVSLEVFGVRMNAMGRTIMWEAVYSSATESPWLGNGPGSTVAVLHSKVSPEIDHPHNDYLRLFHDYGILLTILWVGALVRIFLRSGGRSWSSSSSANPGSASVDRAVAALTVFLLATMVTDNVVSYIFVAGPIGYAIGLSLSLARTAREVEALEEQDAGAVAP
jgi:O-antigen ligase